MTNTLKRENVILQRDIIRTTLITTALFVILLLLFWGLETFCPQLQGELLLWEQVDYYFSLFGSLVGVIYVLLIRNPKNYLGYIFGILMSVFLSLQFWWQEQYDLVILYLCVFVPIQVCTFISWRKNLIASLEGRKAELHPTYLTTKQLVTTILAGTIIWFADYVVIGLLHGNTLGEEVILRSLSGLMIASSCLANYLLLFQKTESWICWVLFSIIGIVFNYLIGSYFTSIFFIVSAIVNGKALIEWVKISK